MKKIFGTVAATAVVGVLAATPVFAEGHGKEDHKCHNNTCDGKSACKGAGNANCKGQNKGKTGWLEASDKAACEAAGGKWMEGKKHH